MSHWTPLVAPFIVSVLIDELSSLNRFDGWIFPVLSLVASTILAVTTHRLVLLGSNDVPKYGFKAWGRRETLFFAYMVIIEIAIFAVAMVPFIVVFFTSISVEISGGAVFWMPLILGIAIALYISSRFSLVLPATAVDHQLFMSGAWNQSRKHQGSIFLIFGIIPLSLSAPGFILYFLDSLIIEVVVSFLVPIGIVIGIVLLSITYEEITKTSDA